MFCLQTVFDFKLSHSLCSFISLFHPRCARVCASVHRSHSCPFSPFVLVLALPLHSNDGEQICFYSAEIICAKRFKLIYYSISSSCYCFFACMAVAAKQTCVKHQQRTAKEKILIPQLYDKKACTHTNTHTP